MLKLIEVELKKIFSKKSIYIVWGLMFLFCILNNVLFFTDYDEDGNYKYLETDNLKTEKNKLEQELNKYNKDNDNEVNMYITIKTKLDIINLKEKYPYNSWQYHKINNYFYDIIYQINYFTYIEVDEISREEKIKEYDKILNKFKNDEYKYFLNIEITKLEDIISNLKEEYQDTSDIKTKKEIEQDIKNTEFSLKILKYRLVKNIKEDNSYLNLALENYQENYQKLIFYNRFHNLTYQEKLDYQNTLSNTKISQYIVNNKININKQNTLAYQLRTILEDYELFFVILILMVTSSIICDEFKDGTIKLLLIKPYSRCKILLGKYLASIISIVVSILLLIVFQLCIGGIIFKFNSLKTPIVIYNFNTSSLIQYSVFKYMLIRILFKIPLLLVLIGLSMFLGVLTSSVLISITLPLMIYMFNPTLIYLTKQYNLYFMKYLVNLNWNLENYLFGKLPDLPFINFKFSLIIVVTYLILLLIITFIVFRKKNIKNI